MGQLESGPYASVDIPVLVEGVERVRVRAARALAFSQGRFDRAPGGEADNAKNKHSETKKYVQNNFHADVSGGSRSVVDRDEKASPRPVPCQVSQVWRGSEHLPGSGVFRNQGLFKHLNSFPL